MAEFCCANLAQEWDGLASIRKRVRDDKGNLFMGDATADMSNKVAVNNQDFLLPLLVRFHQSALKLPEIEGLRTSVQELYNINQREVNEAVVDDEAWACRKLLVHVKRKSQKKLVSLDTQLYNGPLHFGILKRMFLNCKPPAQLIRTGRFKTCASSSGRSWRPLNGSWERV